ncbi:hypothetical protein P5F71_07595 [Clostridium perfringens]|nr:hypothetical protein [Clostridium perfringens]
MGKNYGKLNEFMNTIVAKILSSDEVCKFLKYYGNNIDVLSQPNLTGKEKKELLNNKIYLTKRIPDVQRTAQATLQIRFTDIDFEQGSTQVDKIRFYIYIICHHDTINTANGCRDLCLLTALHKVFDKTDIGIGRLKHWRTHDLSSMGDFYQGYGLSYELYDFIDKVRE